MGRFRQAPLEKGEKTRTDIMQKIGEKIRILRKDKKITLKELADRSGMSVSFISNLERELCSPTIENLQKICGAMDVSLISLLDGKNWNSNVIRAESRDILYQQDGQIRYESLSFGKGRLEGLIIEIQPNCVYEKEWTHSYDELGLILEGELTIVMNQETYVLKEGDSFYIPAMSRHNLSNHSQGRCRSYWVKPVMDDHV